MSETGFKGSFRDFSDHLKTAPEFFYDTPEQLLSGYRDIAKRIDPALMKQFGKIPRLQYGVVAVPAASEKSQPSAFYVGGSLRAGRPGLFNVNTYKVNTRPKWEMEALALHEAVPGHHLQMSLVQEMENVPDFRKHAGYGAYSEGWGLYSESLGAELGLYNNSYSAYGQLSNDMWRSIRLVVDTGMHSMGWSRQKAIDYFRDNSSKSDHDIEVEIDRYIVWAGQALCYKIGQLKIQEIKDTAKRELGSSFEVRHFHDAVLSTGVVPIDILKAQMNLWIAKEKNLHVSN
jgi:prolyl oligopeptidase